MIHSLMKSYVVIQSYAFFDICQSELAQGLFS